MNNEKDLKRNIKIRLRKIEGQVKGIEKMVDEGNQCQKVLIQIAAVRAAINKVGSLILENYAKECANENADCKKIEDLVSTVNMFLK